MSKPLTKLQTKVFEFICDHTEEEGFPPSYQEIAKKFEFSSDGTVRTYLEHLEKKGYIQRLGKARGLKILKQSHHHAIPIVGRIAAGVPSLAVEDALGSVEELPELKFNEGRFALRVKGDSMKNAGIMDGDLAIIQKGVPILNGNIAAVVIDGEEATLKRVFYEKKGVRLQPENDDYQAIIIPTGNFDVSLCGKFIALVRQA